MEQKDYFETRNTVRNYTAEPVGDELITELLRKAAHAPNTGNMQTYSVIVTRDEEMKRKLSPLHFNQPCSVNAAALLTFCADFNRFTRWCRISDADPGYDNFHSFVSAMIDCSLFAQQFNTVAELSGLGCCFLGTTTYNAPQIAELLELPKLVVPVTTIALGWRADNGMESGRLPVEAVIHSEKYRIPTDEELSKLYSETESREDSRKFIAENGKKTLAQVFTDVRYTRESNEHFSRLFFDFIQSQGYKMPR